MPRPHSSACQPSPGVSLCFGFHCLDPRTAFARGCFRTCSSARTTAATSKRCTAGCTAAILRCSSTFPMWTWATEACWSYAAPPHSATDQPIRSRPPSFAFVSGPCHCHPHTERVSAALKSRPQPSRSEQVEGSHRAEFERPRETLFAPFGGGNPVPAADVDGPPWDARTAVGLTNVVPVRAGDVLVSSRRPRTPLATFTKPSWLTLSIFVVAQIAGHAGGADARGDAMGHGRRPHAPDAPLPIRAAAHRHPAPGAAAGSPRKAQRPDEGAHGLCAYQPHEGGGGGEPPRYRSHLGYILLSGCQRYCC